MNLLDAIGLGILQGLTEFLPVSSSGHLTVAQYLLKYSKHNILFDVVVHVGTLLAVLWVFRESLAIYVRSTIGLVRPSKEVAGMGFLERCQQDTGLREIFWIGAATFPTAVIGLTGKKYFEQAFSSPTTVAWMFVVTGALLLLTRFLREGDRECSTLGLMPALIIGIAQGLAITPGISRSGTTIAFALIVGMRRDEAARFSFLLAIPAIAGAALLELRKLHGLDGLLPFLVGGVAAAVTGFFALVWLLKLVRKGKLYWFTPYLWTLATVLLVYLSMQK
ncbi:MAG: undecaprenyl-diphosphate phosphatase [Myxococcales bacterium]|nr:undecaprenyl-diphosphate phosphatase [Myxococcales bacterium]